MTNDRQERIVFMEAGSTSQHIKLIANCVVTSDMLEAIEGFVERERKRIVKR